jgi:hypothetical protein
MKPVRHRLVLALALVFSVLTGGCLSSEMNRWKGQPMDALIETWGPPSKEGPLPGGGKMLVYISPDRAGVGGMIAVTTCQKIFTVDADGIIQAWSLQGC